jgi:hypothetical protein
VTRDTVTTVRQAFANLRTALLRNSADAEDNFTFVARAAEDVCNLNLDQDLIAIAQDPRVAVQDDQPLVTAVLNALDGTQGQLHVEVQSLKNMLGSTRTMLDTERAKVARLERQLTQVADLKINPPVFEDPEPCTPDEDEEAGTAYTLPPGQFQRGYSDRYVMQSNGALVFYLQGKPSAVLDASGRYHRLP